MSADQTAQQTQDALTGHRFISEAAHKIKGPLTSIQLYSESLLDGNVGALTSEQAEYVKEINDASHRLVTMLKDLESQAPKK
ncbi:MAG: histidine kinase dimerization/phospho-acceptor domain-containing protein [Patescibacteria group bacterium]